MNQGRSINLICEKLEQSGLSGSPGAEILENIALHAFFAPPVHAASQEVCQFAHDLNNKLTVLLWACEQYEVTLRNEFKQIGFGDIIIDRLMQKLLAPRTHLFAALNPVIGAVQQELKTQGSKNYAPTNYTIDELMQDAVTKFSDPKYRFEQIQLSNTNTGREAYVDKSIASPIFIDAFKNAAEAMEHKGSIEVKVEPYNVSDIQTFQDTAVLRLLQRRLAKTGLNTTAYDKVSIINSGPPINPDNFATARTTKEGGHGIGSMNIAARVQDCRGFYSVSNIPEGVEVAMAFPKKSIFEYALQLPLNAPGEIVPYVAASPASPKVIAITAG